jgi:tetratricopeptide (TPR) repeat protein
MSFGKIFGRRCAFARIACTTIACVALILGFTLASPAFADQTDARLGTLFDQLLVVDNGAEALKIERAIWNIWFEIDGDDINSLLERGRNALSSNQLAFAEKLYDELIEVAPDFAEGWNRRATVRYMRGNISGSITDIEVTLKLEPRHFGAISGLGLCRIALEDFNAAATAFRDVLAINPHAAGPMNNLKAIEQMLKNDSI